MFAAPLQCTLADLSTKWEIPPPPFKQIIGAANTAALALFEMLTLF
jgi:hypothetical protein